MKRAFIVQLLATTATRKQSESLELAVFNIIVDSFYAHTLLLGDELAPTMLARWCVQNQNKGTLIALINHLNRFPIPNLLPAIDLTLVRRASCSSSVFIEQLPVNTASDWNAAVFPEHIFEGSNKSLDDRDTMRHRAKELN